MKHAKIPKRIDTVNELLKEMSPVAKPGPSFHPVDSNLVPILQALMQYGDVMTDYIFSWTDKAGMRHSVCTTNLQEVIALVEGSRKIIIDAIIKD